MSIEAVIAGNRQAIEADAAQAQAVFAAPSPTASGRRSWASSWTR